MDTLERVEQELRAEAARLTEGADRLRAIRNPPKPKRRRRRPKLDADHAPQDLPVPAERTTLALGTGTQLEERDLHDGLSLVHVTSAGEQVA